MTQKPWVGSARPMPAGAFAHAAAEIGCEEAAIRAVWDVEAGGKGYLSDGSLIRRFEPHKMPGSQMNWRESMKIGQKRREAMFLDAYRSSPDAALRASSWGGPQIMGFNHKDAGYATAESMVRDMADSESAQLRAFTRLVQSWGLDSAIRAHDWQTFETRYNGGGQGGAYARKIEARYRHHSGGRASPTVLRMGDRGSAVRELQESLGIEVDGAFGPATDEAVREFQHRAGLPVDGIVGKRTWAALEKRRDAEPKVQKTRADKAIDRAVDIVTKGGGGAGVGVVVTEAIDRAPVGAVNILFYGAAGLIIIAAALLMLRWYRRAA